MYNIIEKTNRVSTYLAQLWVPNYLVNPELYETAQKAMTSYLDTLSSFKLTALDKDYFPEHYI